MMRASTDMYADVNGLQSIRQQAKTDGGKALGEVAKQFEAMFMQMLLKNVRSANQVMAKDNPLNSFEMKFHQEMLDSQMGISLSEGQGMGLAQAFERQMRQAYGQQMGLQPGQVTRPQQLASLDTVPRVGRAQLPPMPGPQQPALAASVGTNSAESDWLNTISASVVDQEQHSADRSVAQEQIDRLLAQVVQPSKVERAETLPSRFESPQQFVAAMYPIAEKVAAELGVSPKAIVAQAALETGWGQKIMGHADGSSSHNLFGIKADQRWDGDKVTVQTLEYRQGIARKERANFRSYDSYADSMRDYGRFLQNSSRYQHALQAGDNIHEFAKGLQQGGYATDPKYADKITRIANSDYLQHLPQSVPQG